MRTLQIFILLVLTLSTAFAADLPSSAVVTNREERSYAVTASIRTNGCTLELRRYTKSDPYKQGLWFQTVYVGDKHLLKIMHSVTEKEQSLIIQYDTGYGIVQIDKDLDGKYEMLLVVSLKEARLVDVLLVTDEGWLRHSTSEEFQVRQRIMEGNRRAIDEADKTTADIIKKWNGDFKQ